MLVKQIRVGQAVTKEGQRWGGRDKDRKSISRDTKKSTYQNKTGNGKKKDKTETKTLGKYQ